MLSCRKWPYRRHALVTLCIVLLTGIQITNALDFLLTRAGDLTTLTLRCGASSTLAPSDTEVTASFPKANLNAATDLWLRQFYILNLPAYQDFTLVEPLCELVGGSRALSFTETSSHYIITLTGSRCSTIEMQWSNFHPLPTPGLLTIPTVVDARGLPGRWTVATCVSSVGNHPTVNYNAVPPGFESLTISHSPKYRHVSVRPTADLILAQSMRDILLHAYPAPGYFMKMSTPLSPVFLGQPERTFTFASASFASVSQVNTSSSYNPTSMFTIFTFETRSVLSSETPITLKWPFVYLSSPTNPNYLTSITLSICSSRTTCLLAHSFFRTTSSGPEVDFPYNIIYSSGVPALEPFIPFTLTARIPFLVMLSGLSYHR